MEWRDKKAVKSSRKAFSLGSLEDLTQTQKLQRELTALQKKLQTYEGADDKATIEEEKKRIRKIFDLFDKDKSGDLDAKEFQELAFMLGETLTLSEVEERMKVIDQDDNGTIDFEEFYQWWLSPDHDFLKLSRKTDSLRLLKAKLRSKALMRTITLLNEKASALREETKKEEPKEIGVPQPDKALNVPDGIARINMHVAVGKLQKIPCVFKLDFADEPTQAEQLRNSLGARANDSAIASISLTVKEGVTDFELGEVSGSLKTLFAIAKTEVKFTSYKIQLAQEDGLRVFRIDLLVDKKEYKTFNEFAKFTAAIQPKSLSALLQLSQSPKEQDPTHPLNFNFSFEGEMLKSSMDLVKELLEMDSGDDISTGDEEVSVSEGPQNKSKIMLGLQAMSLLKNLEVDMQLDNMEEFLIKLLSDNKKFLYQQLGLKEGDPFPVNGYALFKPYISAFVAWEIIKAEEGKSNIPPELLETYYSGFQLFEGIHSARLQIGNIALKVSTKGFDIFSLLPSMEELQETKKRMKDMGKRMKRSGQRSLTSSRESLLKFSNDLSGSSDEEYDMTNFQRTFVYSSPFDKNGVIYFLDYKLGDTPKVLASGMGKGAPSDFIARDNVFCWSENKPYSWFAVDLGSGRRVIPWKYSLRYGSTGSFCCPRNWTLQGAVTLLNRMDDPESPDWVTLVEHKDDKTLNSPFAVGVWDIPDPRTSYGYQYFRVIQTGPNCYVNPPDKEDNWSHVFVVNGFEIYGDFSSKEDEPQEVTNRVQFNILYDNDTNGIIYYLRKRGVKLSVTSSSIARGQPRDFIKRGEVYCWTQNTPFSWFMVDLGKGRAVTPDYYHFRYGSGGNACCPRNWLLQGANELTDQTSNPDSEDWTTLSAHKNDQRIKGDHCSFSEEIHDCTESFRYFRIIQTGPNSFSGGSGWKDVLVASGFEIYGTLHTLEGADGSSESEEWSGSGEYDSD